MTLTRREFMTAAAALPWLGLAADVRAAMHSHVLEARAGRQQLVPANYPDSEIWSFNGTAPGPELRVRQGDTLRVQVKNALPQPTTVHWHGIRLPNAMDGVPHLTQPPIAQGGEFHYEFALPDAGTYWYHPHERSNEQVARGLYGALIVEERTPLPVDRDVTWVLSDWRLNRDASQVADFDDNFFDLTHAGRVGNTVTVNGKFTPIGGEFAVRAGERLRLRLVNAAAARIFQLKFDGHAQRVIALDGHPVAPHAAPAGVVLGPGMRADLIIDCMHKPGERFVVADVFYPRELRVMEFVYRDESPLRAQAMDAAIALPANPLAEPDLARAQRHDIVFQGGAMGSLREAEFNGERMGVQQLVREHAVAWTINGIARKGHVHEPLLTLKRDGHYVLSMHNDTAWHHPIHIHGIAFRAISRNGKPVAHRPWGDTMLMAPRERAEIAFVADNPGDWMFHCHILSHQQGGMMTAIRIS